MPQKLKIKAVMIDLDGTLMHTAPEIARAINLMLTATGKPILEEGRIASYIGEGASVLVKRCLTGKMEGEPEVSLFIEAQQLFFEFYGKNVTESKPYPKVTEGLRDLKNAGFKLACVTNKPGNFTYPLLAANHFLEFFDLVVSGDTLAKKKPHPDQLFYIGEKLGISMAEALLIGDSKTDIAAARNAGCYVFTVPYGYNQGLPIEASAVDGLINNLSDAIDLIN